MAIRQPTQFPTTSPLYNPQRSFTYPKYAIPNDHNIPTAYEVIKSKFLQFRSSPSHIPNPHSKYHSSIRHPVVYLVDHLLLRTVFCGWLEFLSYIVLLISGFYMTIINWKKSLVVTRQIFKYWQTNKKSLFMNTVYIWIKNKVITLVQFDKGLHCGGVEISAWKW